MARARGEAKARAAEETRQEILSKAQVAGLRVRVTPTTVNRQAQQEERQLRDVLDQIRLDRLLAAQRIEDEKKLKDRIKMAKRRAKKK